MREVSPTISQTKTKNKQKNKIMIDPRRTATIVRLATLALGIAYSSAFTGFYSNTRVLQRMPIVATRFGSHEIVAKTRTVNYIKKENNNEDDFDMDTLEERIGLLRLKILEEDLSRPPNSKFSPKEFVEAVLEGLFFNEDPRPDAGFMLLLRCSTPKWASSVLESIGAPKNVDLDMAASALGSAIARPHNQFAILVGSDEEDNDADERHFYVDFPGETLDFLDGTAWVNVEFRDKSDNSLLVLTGWQLCQRPDGAWLIDQIDWQDYREEYWPGIGREEWMPYEGRRR